MYTYLLTPWCRVLLEKLTGLQLVKKFPTFHGTRRFITALTSLRHMSLSWASPIQSIYPHPTSWRSILILSTHPRLGLPSGPKYTHTGLNAAALLWRRNARLLYRINHLPGDEQQFRLVFPQSVRVFRVFSSFLELKLLLETFYTDLDVFGVFGTWAPGLLRLNFGHYLRDRIWHILTYSMEPSPSWEANWFCN